jgi:heme/copper-type cytochrome/quinol oxidase subunit 2
LTLGDRAGSLPMAEPNPTNSLGQVKVSPADKMLRSVIKSTIIIIIIIIIVIIIIIIKTLQQKYNARGM